MAGSNQRDARRRETHEGKGWEMIRAILIGAVIGALVFPAAPYVAEFIQWAGRML